MASFLVQVIFFLVLARAGLGIVLDECAPVRCRSSGPEIRFPFWLRDHHPETCGYPGFELTCRENNDTMFHLQVPVRSSGAGNLKNITLPVSVQGTVREIDYKTQIIKITSPTSSCLPDHIPEKNSTPPLTSQFEVYTYKNDFSLFNCSSNHTKHNRNYGNRVRCLSGGGYDVFALSFYSRMELPLTSCFKMFDIFEVSSDLMVSNFEYAYVQDWADLHWSEPSCGDCESRGHVCKLDTNTRQTFCFGVPEQPQKRSKKGVSRGALATGLGISFSLLLLIAVLLSGLICLRKKKEDRKKHETLLENYKAHRPTRFSYTDIKKMTSQFREKLGQRNHGTTYKGKLMNDGSAVAVKMLNSEESVGKLVKKMDGIQHENVARLVGYCEEGSKRGLVFEFFPNGTLEKPNKSLDFKDLYHTAIGIAKGIDHLHHGCNQEVLHLRINPRNVLLDHNHNPKLTGYGILRSYFKEQLMLEYVSPEVLSSNYGNATVKSDVYSFGILLFEMVGKAEPGGEVYLPEWISEQLDRREEMVVQIDGEEGNDEDKMKRKMMVVGLWCTQWYPWNRPSMKAVLQMLQGGDMPAVPPNPFAPTESM